jgi:hypothetical protein
MSTVRMTSGYFAVADGARNRALMREVNEHVRGLQPRRGLFGKLDVGCECGARDCDRRIRLAVGDYEDVRAIATRFVVCPEHANGDAVVVETTQFVVIELSDGSGAEVAIRLDPRQRRRWPA